MENEFQLYLAGQLDLLGRRRYSVVREPQLAEATRRDISVRHSAKGWKATLELKVTSGNWTIDEYRRSLKNQLVGLYMKERQANIGFFVVLRQTRRTWMGPKGRTTFDGLLELLVNDANKLMVKKPTLRLRVIGIDAAESRVTSAREPFADIRKVTSKRNTKSAANA